MEAGENRRSVKKSAENIQKSIKKVLTKARMFDIMESRNRESVRKHKERKRRTSQSITIKNQRKDSKMEYYKQEIADILADKVAEGYETKEEILNRWADGDTQDDFGNLTGSRFCSTYKAQEALKEAGFPFDEELNGLLEDVGYNMDILNKGAEAVDVILCELVAPYIIEELRGEK